MDDVVEDLRKVGIRRWWMIAGDRIMEESSTESWGLQGAVAVFVVVMGVMVYHHTHKTSKGPYQEPVQSRLKFHTLFLKPCFDNLMFL